MAEEIRTLPSGVQYKVIDGVYGGLVGNEADIASMTNTYNQTEDLVSALGEATESDTETYKYSGDKTGKTVTFDDGSVLTQKGYSFKYEDADGNPLELDTAGLKASSDSKNDALSTVVGGIKRDLTEGVYEEFGGEDGTLVSEYLSDQAALAAKRAKSDERKDEAMFGKGGTMDQLNDQVQREADALGITPTQYYNLPFSQRAGMAVADLGEVFDSSQGKLFQKPNDIDPNNPRNLGVLGSENIERFQNVDDKDSIFFTDALAPNTTYTTDPAYLPYDASQDLMFMGEADAQDYPLAGGLNIGGFNITAGDPVGPGAGSNTGSGGSNVGGGGDGNGGQPDDDFNDIGGGIGVGVPVIGPGDIGGGTGGTGGGIGTGGGVPVAGTKPDPSTYIVPSTANYGTDPRFANLAPTYKVSKAAMPIFNRFDPAPSIPPVSAGQTLPEGYKIINGQVYQDPNVYAETDAGVVGTQLALNPVGSPPTSLLAQGGIVGLAGGGDPMDQVSKDFFIRQIPRALTEKDGGGMARKLANIHDIHDLGIDEDTFLALKYYRGPGGMKHGGVAERGYSHEGIGSLSDTARNMFRPMVS